MAINGVRSCSFCIQCQRFFLDEDINSHMQDNPLHFIEERTIRADILDQEIENPSISLRIYERTSACQVDFIPGIDLNTPNDSLPVESGSLTSIGYMIYSVISGAVIEIPVSGVYRVSWNLSAEITDPILGVNRKILSTSITRNGSVVTGSQVNDYGRSEDGGLVSVAGEYFLSCYSNLTTIGICSENSGAEGGFFTVIAGALRIEMVDRW